MEASIMNFFLKIELILLCLCWNTAVFKIWIWADVLFGSFYHAWIPLGGTTKNVTP